MLAVRVPAAHLMIADPDLAVSAAIGLPSGSDGNGRRRYERTVLTARGGEIEMGFRPPAGLTAAYSAHQALAWLGVHS